MADRYNEVVARFPSRTALRSPAGHWTYAELDTEVRRRAAGIAALVDGPGPIVIVAEHDGPLVIAILATVVSGNVVVVLDPAAVHEQLVGILDECAPQLLVHDERHGTLAVDLASSAAVEPTVVAIDQLGGPDDAADREFVLAVRGPQDPVMLAFTSGTSGTPKGAVITHGVLMNLVRGATDALDITPDDRMPMLFPTSLAVAAYPLFIPLLNGGCLSTLDVRTVGLAPVADFLSDERITLAYLAPTVVRFLVDALAGREFPDLRLVALGGEVVDAEVVELARNLFDPEFLANGYGTTETGVVALFVIDPDTWEAGAVPVGHPVADVDLRIFDDSGTEVAVGASGEIAVISPYLFSGYWGRPELGRQVLLDDPDGRAGWKMYRTGDYGHVDATGALVVSGRLGTKVKIRGRFVELGFVESLLHALPDVSDAAVVARTRDGVQELVGYVVLAAGADATGHDLRATLLASNEAFYIPGTWVVLDELPRLPNGKTDRRALPGPEAASARPTGGSPDGEGTDRVRDDLRVIWERLLPVGPVADDQDFFVLGGDSLLAAQMLVSVELELGVLVPMGELVHARTIRDLATVIVRIRRQPDVIDSVTCVQEGDHTRPRLWFVHDLQGSGYRVRHLAASLGEDQPVWSFESPFLRGEPNRFSSLDTFVAEYLVDLKARQPEGPYWLAGYSFGGICAYEMARQLRRAGDEVAFLGVIDVGPGYRGEGWHARRSPFRPWFGVLKPPPRNASFPEKAEHYATMIRRTPTGAARHIMVRSGLARIIDPIRFRRDLRVSGQVRPAWRLWYAWEEHWNLAAVQWSRENTYDGRVDLFWANESPSSDSTMGWGPLVADLRIHRFDGDHLGILEPSGAALLAAELRSAIDGEIDVSD